MSVDRRELILARLEAIAAGLTGVMLAKRGLRFRDDTQLPAIAIADGDETASEEDERRRPNGAPRYVTMQPRLEIWAREEGGDYVGTVLNRLRAELVRAVVADAALLGLTLLGEGSTRYDGCTTESEQGRSTIGSMTIGLAVTYVLRPDEL